MLSLMRAFARSKVALVVIAFLIVGLAAYALPNVFNGGQPRGVISAGDRFVVEGDISRRIDRIVEQSFREGQRMSRVDIAQSGLANELIQVMAIETAQQAFADDNGIRASRLAVSETVANAPVFQDPVTGEFSSDTYRQETIRFGFRSIEEFERTQRDELTIDYIQNAAPAGVDIADVIGSAWALALSEERFVSFVKIPASVSDEVLPPTAEELEAFYNEQKELFREPERRAVSVLSISSEDFIDNVEVTESDVQDYYDFRIKDYSTPETRTILEMRAQDRALVQRAVDELGLGRDPREVASSIEGLMIEERSVQQDNISNEAFARALFQIPAGDFVFPIEVDDRWRTAVVLDIIPGIAQPLNTVSDDIRRTLAEEGAVDVYEEELEQFYDLIGGGFSLEEAAEQIGAPLMRFQAVDNRGFTVNGSIIGAFAQRPDVIRMINEMTFEGEVGEVVDDELTGGVLVVRLDTIEPSDVPELADIQERVELAYMYTKRAEAVQLQTSQVLDKAQELNDLAGAAQEFGYDVISPELPVSSRGAPEELGPAGVMAVRNATLGQFVEARHADGGAHVIQLVRVNTFDGETLPFMAGPAKDAIREEILGDVQNALMNEIFTSADIQFNSEKLTTYLNQMAGEE